MLADPGFKVPSQLAADALHSAKLLLEWSSVPENRDRFDHFASAIVADLQAALPTNVSAIRLKVQREKIWGNYHTIRSSRSYTEKWLGVLELLEGCEACPIFYQFVTDHVFRQLIKTHFPLEQEHHPSQQQSLDLTYEEESGLRYAAGYVCRAMKKKLGSNDPDMLSCIEELADSSENESSDPSNDWTKLASRGGLLTVKDTTYLVFHAMELVVRQFFRKSRINRLTPGAVDVIIEEIKQNEDVAFYWCMAAADMDERLATTLLHGIVKLWVTIRGFSFSSAWVELYKQESKKSLQRSKGLRKALFQQKYN